MGLFWLMDMEEFVVYVLFSESGNRLYVGYSSNSLERFYWHNLKSKKGFTTRYRPWKMIHIEFFDDARIARKREKQLKGGQGREWLRNVILGQLVEIGFISAWGGRQFNSASRYTERLGFPSLFYFISTDRSNWTTVFRKKYRSGNTQWFLRAFLL